MIIIKGLWFSLSWHSAYHTTGAMQKILVHLSQGKLLPTTTSPPTLASEKSPQKAIHCLATYVGAGTTDVSSEPSHQPRASRITTSPDSRVTRQLSYSNLIPESESTIVISVAWQFTHFLLDKEMLLLTPPHWNKHTKNLTVLFFLNKPPKSWGLLIHKTINLLSARVCS